MPWKLATWCEDAFMVVYVQVCFMVYSHCTIREQVVHLLKNVLLSGWFKVLHIELKKDLKKMKSTAGSQNNPSVLCPALCLKVISVAGRKARPLLSWQTACLQWGGAPDQWPVTSVIIRSWQLLCTLLNTNYRDHPCSRLLKKHHIWCIYLYLFYIFIDKKSKRQKGKRCNAKTSFI